MTVLEGQLGVVLTNSLTYPLLWPFLVIPFRKSLMEDLYLGQFILLLLMELGKQI